MAAMRASTAIYVTGSKRVYKIMRSALLRIFTQPWQIYCDCALAKSHENRAGHRSFFSSGLSGNRDSPIREGGDENNAASLWKLIVPMKNKSEPTTDSFTAW